MNRGTTLFERGEYAVAMDAYREAIRLNPTYAGPHIGLGNCLWGLGRQEEALHAYRAAVWVEPDNPDARRALDWALERVGTGSERGAFRRTPNVGESVSGDLGSP